MQKSAAMTAFSENVMELVKRDGITLKDLADRCGMRRSYLSRLVHGHHSPSLEFVENIAKALGVEAHELITPDFSKNLLHCR